MASTLRFFVDATQAKAELAALRTMNKAYAAEMQMAYGAVNKALMAGVAGIAAMGAGFAAAYMANADFNKALTHTQALSDLTATEMKRLGDMSRYLGITYGESSNVIAEGLVVLGKAGLTYQEMITAMPTMVQMMKANAVDFETAANIAMMSVNAFKLEYEDLALTMDKAQKTVQATLLDIEGVQQGLQYAASTAALAGVPFESLMAMMGTLADNAMVAGIGARSMNKMMLDIVQNTDQVQRWADSMGLGVQVVKDGKLNIDEIIPAFAKLGMSLETLIDSSDIFTVRALRSWGILIGHADEYTGLLDEINNAQGELDRTTQIQITSLSSMMAQMKEMFMAPFKTGEFTDSAAEVLNKLKDVIAGLAPLLADLVLRLSTEFGEILPYLVGHLEGFVKAMERGTSLLGFFAKAVAGTNPLLLRMWILFMLLRRTKILEMITNMVNATIMYRHQLEVTTDAEVLSVGVAQARTAAYMRLAQAVVGVGFGLAMLLGGATKEARALGAITTAVMVAAAAFQYLAIMRSMAIPHAAAIAIGAGAAVAAAGLGYAYLMPDKTYDIPETNLGDLGLGDDFVGTGATFQRGTRVIGGNKPRMVIAHPGEQITSANEDPAGAGSGGAVVVKFENCIVGEGAYEEIERELAKRMRRDRGRY